MSDNGNEQAQAEAAAGADSQAQLTQGRKRRKVRVGVVVSDKADKTIVVMVERRLAHPLYGKGVARTKRYHVHDEGNEYKVGDTVRIAETRPLSKTKRWRVVGLVDRPA
jgi:small subunit ribosomal protein S17